MRKEFRLARHVDGLRQSEHNRVEPCCLTMTEMLFAATSDESPIAAAPRPGTDRQIHGLVVS